jgi:hypothetical protein
MNFTFAQFLGFLSSVTRQERQRSKWLAIAARAAQYESNDWKKFLKAIDDGE